MARLNWYIDCSCWLPLRSSRSLRRPRSRPSTGFVKESDTVRLIGHLVQANACVSSGRGGSASAGCRRVCASTHATWRPSSAGSRSGKSARQVRAAASPRARARSAAIEARERVRVVEQALAGPRRVRTRPASRHSASRVARSGARQRRRRRRAARVRLGRAARRAPARAARRAEHEALAERVRGEPVGAVQAGARGLADGVEARARVERAVEVGDDAAHHVVRGGRDRDELARRVEARLAQRARRRSGTAPGRRRACRGRPTARPSSRIGARRSRARPRRAARARRRSARRRRRAASRPRRGSPR